MYDYFRFEAKSLSVITQSTQNGTRVFAYGEDERIIVDAFPSILDAAFRARSGPREAGALGPGVPPLHGVAEALAAFDPSNAKHRRVRGGVAAGRGSGDFGGVFPLPCRGPCCGTRRRGGCNFAF